MAGFDEDLLVNISFCESDDSKIRAAWVVMQPEDCYWKILIAIGFFQSITIDVFPIMLKF